MNIFPYNKTTQTNIKQILKNLMLSMNGVSSDRMTESGIIYRKNYGVSLPRIKEIAKNYTKNAQLATQLWSLKYRETMILATMLYPNELFNSNLAKQWASEACSAEICEQLVYNLVLKTDYAKNIALEWINGEQQYIQICGFLAASRTCEQFSQNECNILLNLAIKLSKTDSHPLAHAISVSLRFFCRLNKQTAELILSKICTFESTEIMAQKYIYQEVKQEISFFYESQKENY